MRKFNFVKMSILFLGFSFLYVPIVILVLFSFNEASLTTAWSGFSLRWYQELFKDTRLIASALLSLKLAVLVATGALIVGTWAGYVLVRKAPFKGFTLFAGLLNAPLVIPDVVLGISLLLMIVEIRNALGLNGSNGLFTLWLGHVILCSAYVTVIISTRVRELDKTYEEAALDLGATPLTVFFKIILPSMVPAMVSSWLLSFTLSLDDVVISSFMGGTGYTTLPVEIFSRVRLGVKPEVNALATLVIMVVGVCIVVANRVHSHRNKMLKESS